MHPLATVEHQEPEAELAELLTTHLAVTEPQMEHAVQLPTGAVAAVAARQLPAQMQEQQVATAATDVFLQSLASPPPMQAVAAVAAVTPAFPAVHLLPAVTAEQAAAEMADPPRGMEHTVAQALVSAEQQTPVAAVAAVAIALPISADPLTAVAAMVAPASLSCVTCFPLLQLPTSRLPQTTAIQRQTTLCQIEHLTSRAMHQ